MMESILVTIPFGDMIHYLSGYTGVLFGFAAIFVLLAVISLPEKPVEIVFGTDGYSLKETPVDLARFQRFMAIACGIATIGAIVTGDIFNFTLFAAFIGVLNIGIVAAVKNKHVLSAAFSYGLVVMMGTVPLFAGAAIIAATTGTLSIWELAATGGVPVIAKLLLLIGVLGEGMAPFYIGKAEITRASGAPYILMIHVSSLLLFLRVVEILLTV
ncbi:membrane protein-like protein [Methanocorpusculum labreanum Z]|uniref:Membrane protein-like protein n=1 Tax=Methanocorpusculum labreanum (strain ATCC 43576 / DSM 4855 / Z) TaxID=410358 RepID=A2SQY5_METLZ|nr:membrane protein [Methanocorpusculum labreanum]ABN06741.1 membrane protein-like protein [Methanocorpusculum labreanum Z]